jgi:hypothetical protein
VFADYQYAWFENDTGELTVHRFSGGVQHRVAEPLFLRAGATSDQHGNVGLLAGLSFVFAKWGSVDFGYQYDTLPELDREFGTSHTFQLTLGIRF